MRPRLVPLFFDPGRDGGFDIQLTALGDLLGDEADLLPAQALGQPLPAEADAVLFPQLLGEAYRLVPAFQNLDLPILVVTSEFGTMSMWDWELISYLETHGVTTIAPYDLAQTKMVLRGLRVRRELREAKFLVFQDNPGDGAQASIFKRFYWWEDECTQRLFAKFGVTIVKRSFRELGAGALEIPDEEADEVWRDRPSATADVPPKGIRSAVKLYLAVKRELDRDPQIRGVGINCLNESHFSDTTPCLAWNMLYQERGLIWGCEADTMSMLSKYILHRSLDVPIMMTNLYPFLMGQAALKHERIESFPEVDGNPENHVLVAHCGYLGVLPTSFSTEWTLRPKALAIVDNNATAIDARLPTGPITLAKLHPDMTQMTVAEGKLKGYSQHPGSDCLNGGVIEISDGHQLMNSLASHHYLLTTGHNLVAIRLLAKVFGLEIQAI